jgi:DNA-binding MarR family transcriptional regulator
MVDRFAGTVDYGILLGLAYQAFADALRAHLARRGFDDLGASYGYVFRALARERPSQRELARGLGITDQGMAKILAEMIERRYVAREVDLADARVHRLSLGPRGQRALAAARRFHAQFERRLRRKLGPARAAALRRELEALALPAQGAARTRLRAII